jgi:ActR/RegA family two-component response regulator
MQAADLLRAIAQLLWPVVVAILVFVLLPVIRSLIKSSDSINVEVGGAKISVQSAAEDIRKLISDLQDRLNVIEGRATLQGGEVVAKAPTVLRPTKFLWVDDRPGANVYERARVRDAGYEVLQAESTAAAERLLATDGPVQMIVTDMARVENAGKYNPTAGLDLINDLREANDFTPVVVYSSTRSLAPVIGDLRKMTNVQYTTSPTELISLIGIAEANRFSDSPPN